MGDGEIDWEAVFGIVQNEVGNVAGGSGSGTGIQGVPGGFTVPVPLPQGHAPYSSINSEPEQVSQGGEIGSSDALSDQEFFAQFAKGILSPSTSFPIAGNSSSSHTTTNTYQQSQMDSPRQFPCSLQVNCLQRSLLQPGIHRP